MNAGKKILTLAAAGMMLAGLAAPVMANGSQEDTEVPYGFGGPRQGYSRGQGGPGRSMGPPPLTEEEAAELPQGTEKKLTGTFSYQEGIPVLQADGKTYHVMASAYQINAQGIVSDGDTVTVEGLFFEPWDDPQIPNDGRLLPQKVTVGSQTYILAAGTGYGRGSNYGPGRGMHGKRGGDYGRRGR